MEWVVIFLLRLKQLWINTRYDADLILREFKTDVTKYVGARHLKSFTGNLYVREHAEVIPDSVIEAVIADHKVERMHSFLDDYVLEVLRQLD